ncbi:DivIVA domain-containing protein [Dermabacteraceae bacterium P9123]
MAAEFRRVSIFSKGYNRAEVDEFMRHAQKLRNRGDAALTPELLIDKEFKTQRGGYSMDDVDDALDGLVAAISGGKGA